MTFGDSESDAPVTCDFSTASAAVAYMLADGVELARRIALTSPIAPADLPLPASSRDRAGDVRDASSPRGRAAVPRSAVSLSVDGGRDSLPARPDRDSRSTAALRNVSMHRAGALFLMDGDAPQRRWWQNLRKGVVVEVYYAEDTYAVKTPVGDVPISETAFAEGTCCRRAGHG